MQFIRDLGKSLMLPIAVLPVAAILLRLGVLFDMPFIEEAGGVIFANLPVIFALGVAIGFAPDGGKEIAALSALVGYLVFEKSLATLDSSLNTGVIGGLVVGITAAKLYERFHQVKIPSFLAFFGGNRLIPILSGLSSVIYSVIFLGIWGIVQQGLNALGSWIIASGAIGLFLYGFLNRLLIVTGLHHVLNTFIWFTFGEYTTESGELVQGDLTRFFAEDPTAGYFMSGFFPIMMFALPALCLAFYLAVPKGKRALAGGLLLSAAFTAFLTGITEVVEFMFMFISPVLYFFHAVMTGFALVVHYLLGIRLGFGFSAGLIDYVLNFNIASNPWLAIPVGLVFAVVYFLVASFMIRRFKIPIFASIAGIQEGDVVKNEYSKELDDALKAHFSELLKAVGGKENIASVTSCITRMRIDVKDTTLLDAQNLERLYPKHYLLVGRQVQCVLGMQAERHTSLFKEFLKTS